MATLSPFSIVLIRNGGAQAAGLIDTIRLIVFPVVLGSGKRLFANGRTPSSFRLTEVTSTPRGVTMQTLELAGPPEYGEIEVE